MTEAEWLAATDPTPMLEFLRDRASDRKLRLFAVALARQFWDRIAEPSQRDAIELAEQGSDGLIDAEAMTAAAKRVDGLFLVRQAEMGATTPLAWYRAATPESRSLLYWVLFTVAPGKMQWLRNTELLLYKMASEVNRPHQLPVLREVFGNPFRHVITHPEWLTSTVVALAEGIYQDRAFDRMPILADALQDAGCENENVLNHCRLPGDHVRGCWVVDLLLGKA